MAVDIITTTFRNVDKLKICLSSVLERTKYVDYKWHIWANDPNEQVKQVIHDSIFVGDIRFNDRIEPIFNDTNNGSFSSNNNEAVEEGSSDYLLFLNDDVAPTNDDWLLNMTRILDSDPKVGAVGALLLYPGKKLIQHCGVFFSNRTNSLPFHMFYRKPINEVAEFVSKYRYYQTVTAACMLVRREDFNKVGGFSEEYFYQYEDVDLCLKIKNDLKKHIVYCPTAQLIHHEGISGTFKKHPKLQENIKVFRDKWSGLYMNDLEFYLNNLNHLIYKTKF